MRLFKQKILSLVTAVCMIATSAAPVFAAEGAADGVTDSGSITVTWEGTDVTSVKVLDSGTPQTVKEFKSSGATEKDLPIGEYTVEVTTKTGVTSVKVGNNTGYTSTSDSNALVWKNANAKYKLEKDQKLTLHVVAESSGGGGDSPTAIDSVQLKKGGTAFDGEAITVGESLTGVALDDQSNEIADNVTYQWQESTTKDGNYTDISGETTDTYTPVNGKIGQWIRVKATGNASNVTGTQQSKAVQVNAKTFTVKLSKSAPSADNTLEVTTAPADAATGATFVWYEGTSADSVTSPISGQTNATLDLATYAGKYIKVVATGTGDYKDVTAEAITTSAVSDAGVTNAQAPEITGDLNDAEVFYTKDAPATALSVTATSPDGGTLSQQWYSNSTKSTTGGTKLEGETNDTFTPPTDTVGTTYYYVVVTNTNNDVNGNKTATTTSNLAMITVKEAVTVSATPTFKTDLASTMAVVVDDTLTLTVEAEASDGGNLSYEWYKDGSKLADVTNAYTKANVTADDAGSYKVVVTNANGALAPAIAESTVCAVTVNQKAIIDQEIKNAGIDEVTVPADQVPTGATLRVDPKGKPTTIATDVSNKINQDPSVSAKVENIDTTNVVSMEITLKTAAGNEQPVGGTLTITMDKPTAFKGNNIVAIHYNKDGSIKEIVIATVTGDQISFRLNGLSPVVLAEYTPKTVTPTPDPKPDNGNNNNSGSSGGSGGGGGGSSGSNKSQSIFQRTTSTINNILKGWFGGVSRRTTTSATGAAAVTGTPVTESAAAKAASSAASQAKAQGSNSFNAIVRNATTVSPKAFEAVASQAQKSGLKGYLAADTMKNGAVDVRVSVLASAASRLGKELNLYAVCGNPAIEKHFNKYFSNKTAVISMSQKGSFGVTVNVAAKVNLNGMNVKNLRIYSYDVASNSYRELPQEACFVDGNGYLHFTTDMGGYIVISDGVLTLH